MAGIRLLSLKRNEEVPYFREEFHSPTTLDSNANYDEKTKEVEELEKDLSTCSGNAVNEANGVVIPNDEFCGGHSGVVSKNAESVALDENSFKLVESDSKEEKILDTNGFRKDVDMSWTRATSGTGNEDETTTCAIHVEGMITASTADCSEDVPRDIFDPPDDMAQLPELNGEQHVEIEISELTDDDDDATSSTEVVTVEQGTHVNGTIIEPQVIAESVEMVEKGVEAPVDTKLEKRKSVRFLDEVEQLEANELEFASLNLAMDLEDDDEGLPAETPDDVLDDPLLNYFAECFEESEKVADATERDQVTVTDGVYDVATKPVNSKKSSNHLEEINLNEAFEETSLKKEETGRRKKSRFFKCCFS